MPRPAFGLHDLCQSAVCRRRRYRAVTTPAPREEPECARTKPASHCCCCRWPRGAGDRGRWPDRSGRMAGGGGGGGGGGARSTSPISGHPAADRRGAGAAGGGMDPVHARGIGDRLAGAHACWRAAQPAGGAAGLRSAGRQGQRQHRFRRRRAVAYNFCISSTDGIADGVFTNENRFAGDWDGNWKHAVAEDARTAGPPRR